ncbi:MAG TPA: lamin tail domain-containing protein [Methylomirabilota bacterium]|nr:lamin tail domain-containing protein [Methylomirabilota bacterium]
MKVTCLLRGLVKRLVFLGAVSLLSLLGLRTASAQSVIINEVLADNDSVPPYDSHPDYFPDYVELKNVSGSTINLGDGTWSLTDNDNNPLKFVFPAGTQLAAGQTLLVALDSETNAPGLHAGFTVRADRGDDLYLYRSDILQDSIVFGIQISDYSIGRVPDGTGEFTLNLPTPRASNTPVTLGAATNLFINEWQALANDGTGRATNDWFELFNSSTNPVALGGLILADRSTFDELEFLPAVAEFSYIPPLGFQVFYCVTNANDADETEEFSLSSSNGDDIYLVAADRMTILDHVMFGPQAANTTQGRLPDGGPKPEGADFMVFTGGRRSPGESNFGSITNVVINEILAHTDPPLEDAIELYNRTATPVDIGDWWISNAADDPKKFRIPRGTIIPAFGFKVFYEGDFNPDGTGQGRSFTLNSARGDEVYIFTGDTNGNLTGFRRGADFGPTENGVSLGRFRVTGENGEDDFDLAPMITRSFGVDSNFVTVQEFRQGTGGSNGAPRVGPIVINEVHYNPGTNEAGDNVLDEFIELLNIAGTTVPLYDPAYPTNSWHITGEVEFELPLGRSLAPDEHLLVVNFDPGTNASQLASFTNRFNVPAGTQIFGPYRGKLRNSRGDVELKRPDTPQAPGRPDAGLVPYLLVDRVNYTDDPPWPTNADGRGMSLQRLVPSSYGNEPLNWTADMPTPGRANPGACLPSLSSTSASFGGIGGSSNVTITTGSGCAWTAVTTNSWITLTSATSGVGNATITYTVATNATAASRTGRIVIAGLAYTVQQLPGDNQPPRVAVARPANNARLTQPTTNLVGTASDNRTVATVLVSVNGGDFEPANGTTAWTYPITLAPGLNTIRVKSIDDSGLESAVATHTLTYVVTTLVTVTTNGTGSVATVPGSKPLEVGSMYTLTATPGSGFVFSNWTRGDTVVSTSNRYTFQVETGLVLTANFIPNPFLTARGSFNGLFYESDEVRLHSAGFINLAVTDKGAFTGKLLLGGKSYKLAGAFDLFGNATNRVPRPGTNGVTVELHVDLADGADQITGRVLETGGWTADELTLDRAGDSAALAGTYTLILPGNPADPSVPAGDGSASVVVDAAGVRLAGTLADGTKVTQKVPLSQEGHWPLFIPIKTGPGLICGWLEFDTNAPDSDVAGTFTWIQPTSKIFPAGFAFDSEAYGARYTAPAAPASALAFTNGVMTFSGGQLGLDFTNTITLNPGSKLVVDPGQTNKLAVTLNAKTGLFTGSVIPPGATRASKFAGAVVQKMDVGSGAMPGTNQVARVRIEAAVP